MIDRATVAKITDAANIVEVVSDYVHLVKRGANYVGLCPFHNERTPSFSVSPKRNFCYCFSCKKGGSPVNFIMEKEGLNYRDALLQLARKYGIKVEEKELTEEERSKQTEREAMLVANEWAMQELAKNLTSTEEGRNVGLSYLYGRGVTDEAIRRFRLGYALDNPTALLDAAKKKGISQDVLRSVGLTGISQQGRPYDRFRGRVIFPVFNPSGKVVAFGGRDLKGGLAKYVNSPESDLYKKSNELYGIFQAKSEIVKQDRCYLVEGYLDVIGMSMAGIENVVASSGTALTDGQIALIHRFTNKITLIYDGDKAGIKAALRGMDMLLSHKMEVSLVLLPDGHDPDSFAKTLSPESFRKFLKDNEVDVLRFKAQVLLDESGKNPQSRIAAITSMVTSLAHIQDETARRVYIQECSNLLHEDQSFIARQTAAVRAKLVETWHQERIRKKTLENLPTEKQDPRPLQESIETTRKEETRRQVESAIAKNAGDDTGHIQRVEYEMLLELLRYGMMVFDRHNTEESMMNATEYVANELEADSMAFTHDPHRRMFEALIAMRPQYERELKRFIEETNRRLKEESLQEYSKLADENHSVNEIRLAEKKLSERLQQKQREEIEDFQTDFPVRLLASDPDDDIRRLVSSMVAERTKLKNSPDASRPSGDSLEPDQLVTKALLTWKDATVTEMINRTTREMQEAALNGDIEKVTALQHKMNRVVQIRRQLSQFIGDRVIDPRVIRRSHKF